MCGAGQRNVNSTSQRGLGYLCGTYLSQRGCALTAGQFESSTQLKQLQLSHELPQLLRVP